MQQGLDDDLYNSVQKYSEVDEFSDREKLAVEFGERFAIDHTAVDEAFFDRLRQHFNDQEILELTITAGFCVGMGRAYQVLDVERDFDVLWSREPATDSGAAT